MPVQYEIIVEPFTVTVGAVWWRRPQTRWRATITPLDPARPARLHAIRLETKSRDDARRQAERWVDAYEQQLRAKDEGKITYTYEPKSVRPSASKSEA